MDGRHPRGGNRARGQDPAYRLTRPHHEPLTREARREWRLTCGYGPAPVAVDEQAQGEYYRRMLSEDG